MESKATTGRMHGASAARRGIVFGLALSALILAGAARSQTLSEFPVPTGGATPYMITTGPDGNLWFTESERNQIGQITPDGSAIREFPIPSPASRPAAIAVGPDGNLWFAERDANKIGQITPGGVVIHEYPTPTAASRPWGIAAGPDGNLWFTEGQADKIGRITIFGVITEFDTPTPGSNPLGITAGPDGNLWFTEGFGNRIGRITPEGVITEFPIPTVDSSPWGIAAGPDGNLWFVEQKGNKVGRITTDGVITEFPIATELAFPFGITAGPDGNLWFTETLGDKIGRITTAGAIAEFAVPDFSEPNGITTGPDGNLWFPEGHSNKIGRLTPTPAGPCVPDSTTLCLNDSRFKLQVAWSVPSQGRSGVGTAVSLTGDTGYFWFFNSDNVELVIKVLDAQAVNGHFWVFYGALSNVEYTITVTDTGTGAVKVYNNPSGTLASVADTSAFVAAAAGSAPAVAASPAELEKRSAEELYGLYAALTQKTMAAAPKALPVDACVPGGTTLCLNDARFQVSVDWEVPSQGRSGHASAVPVTNDTGYFWFFNADNVELMIKVLDGTAVNGHFWVFYGALSNVQYTITVTDTTSGAVKIYTNPSGTLASVADTSAF